MKKSTVYILIVFEIVIVTILGISNCIYSTDSILSFISFLILLWSFILIILLFLFTKNGKLELLFDFILSILIIYLNHAFLGLIFNWELCPLI